MALANFAWHAWALRFVDPPPWPDEAMIADAAAHLARGGALATTLYRESIPSTLHHYHLFTPLYLLLAGGVFAVAGPSLLALRMTSLALAPAVLALLYGIARRAGLGRPSAMGAVSLAAADLVLMRSAHVGRMEMLALLFVIAVVWLGLDPPAPPEQAADAPARRPAGGRASAMGVAAGLAFLSHPLGLIAAPVAVALLVPAIAARDPVSTGSRRLALARALGALALGFGLALLPWIAYVLQDRAAFVQQFGAQFARKMAETRSAGCLVTTLSQWPLREGVVAAVLGTGLAGLALASWNRRAAGGLFLVQLLIVAAVLSGCEQWYAVYLVPLTCVGLARLAALADHPGARGLLGVAALIVASIWALVGAAGMFALASAAGPGGGEVAYRTWSRAIETALPPRSTVMLDLVPTPYFGFRGDRQLELRLFRLPGFGQDPAREEAALDAIDYVVVGRGAGSRTLADSVRSRGTRVAEVAGEWPAGTLAHIYRMQPRRTGIALPGSAQPRERPGAGVVR